MTQPNQVNLRSRDSVLIEGSPENDPKHAMGTKKLPFFSVIPVTGLIEEAKAMKYGAYDAPLKDGGNGYGPYNFRDTKIAASIYIDAMFRHFAAWVDGEELAADSGAHHLGHLRACANIILDALANGYLVDDRPAPGRFAKLLKQESNE